MRNITTDIAWFVGITLGDGSLSGRMVRLWNNEESIIDRWIEILVKRFDIPEDMIKMRRLKKDRKGFKRNKETIESTVNSVEFKRRVKKLLQDTLSSNDIEITRSILQGIFDAEGSINGRCEIVIWQRKNEPGTLVADFVKSGLEKLDIKFRIQNNDDFHIILIPGGLKNTVNIENFGELINFSHPKKKEWLNLVLRILPLNKKISEKEIIQFLQEVEIATVNDMVKHFEVIEHRIRSRLKSLDMKNEIIKSNTWPQRFSLS